MEEGSSNELIKAVLTICSKQDQSNRRMWDLLERLLRFAKGDKDLGNVVARLSQEWISKEQDAYFQPRAMLMLLNLISILKRDGHVHLKWCFALMRGIYYDQKREKQRQYERGDRRRMHRNIPRLQVDQMIGSKQDEREIRRESCWEDGRRARSQIRSIFEVAAQENERTRGESFDQRLESGREEKNGYFGENEYSGGFREEQDRDIYEGYENDGEKLNERRVRTRRNIEYDKDTSLAFKETHYRNTREERSDYRKLSAYNNEARLCPLLKFAHLSKIEKKSIYKDEKKYSDNLDILEAQLAQSECDEETHHSGKARRSVSIGDELETDPARWKDSYEDKTASSRYRTDSTKFNQDSLSRRDKDLSDELKSFPESGKDRSKQEEPRSYINSASEEEYVREKDLNEDELEAQRRRFRKSPLNKLRSARKDTPLNQQGVGYTPAEDDFSSQHTPSKKAPIQNNLRSYISPDKPLSNPSSQTSCVNRLSFYKGPETQLSEEESPYQSKQATDPSSKHNLRSFINKPASFSLKNEDVFSTPPYKESPDSSISAMHLSFGEDQEPSSILVKSQSSEELNSSRATLSSRDKLIPVRSDKFPSFGNQQDDSIAQMSNFHEDLKPCSIPSINIQPSNSLKSLPKHERNLSFGKDQEAELKSIKPSLSGRSNTSRASQYEDPQLSKRSENSFSDDFKSQDQSRSSRSMSIDSPSSSSQLNRSTSNIPRRSRAWQKLLRSGKPHVQDTSISKAPESEPAASERFNIESNSGIPKELKPKLSLQIVSKEGSSDLNVESSNSQDSKDFTFRNDTKSKSKPELSTRSFFGANIEGIGMLESSEEGQVVLVTDTFNSPRHADIDMERAYQDYFTKCYKSDIPDVTNIIPSTQSDQPELIESRSKKDKPLIQKRDKLRSAKIPSAKPDPSIENIENYHLEAIASQEELEISSNPFSETVDRKGFPGLPEEDSIPKKHMKPENKYDKLTQDATENERLSTQTPELSYIQDKLEPTSQLYIKKRNISSLIISKPSPTLKAEKTPANPDTDHFKLNTSDIPESKIPEGPNICTPSQLPLKLILTDEPGSKDQAGDKPEESISGIDESLDAKTPVWNLPNRLKVRSDHMNKSRDSSVPAKLSDQDFEVSAINSSSHSYLPGDFSEAQNASSIEQSGPLSQSESLPSFSKPSNQPAFLSITKPELYSTHGRFQSFNPIYQHLEVSRASGLDIVSKELEEPKARSKSALEITRIYEGARTEPKLEVKIKIKGGFSRNSPEVNAKIENSAEKSERVVETHSLADIEPRVERGRIINRNKEFDLANLIPTKEDTDVSYLTDKQNQRLSNVSRGFRILDNQFSGQPSAQATPKGTNSKELSRHSSVSPMRLVSQPVPASSIFKALESKLSQSRENLPKSSTPELSLLTSKAESASTAKLGHSSQDSKELRPSQYKPEPIEMPISPSYSSKIPPKCLKNHLSASHEPATGYLNHSTDSESLNIPLPQPREDSFGVQKGSKLCLSPNLLTELSKSNPANPSSISHTRYSSIGKQVSDETQPESYSTLSLSPYKQPEKSDTDTSQSQLTNLKASTLPQKRLQFLTQDAQTSMSKEVSESPLRDAQSLEPICNSSSIMQSPEPSFPSYENSRKEPPSVSKPPRSVIRSEDNVHLRSSDSYDTEESIPDFKPSSISNPKYSPSRSDINFDALQIRQLKTPELSEIAGEGHDESYSGPSESFEDMSLSKDYIKSGYLTDEERSEEGRKKSAIYVIDEENSEVTDTNMYDRLSSDPSPRTRKYRQAPRRLEDDLYERAHQDNKHKKQPKDLPMKLTEDKLRLYSEGYPLQKRAHTVAKKTGVGLNQPRQPDSRLREVSPRSLRYNDTSHSYSKYDSGSSDLYSYNPDSISLQSSNSMCQDQSYSNPRSLKDFKEDKTRSKPSKEYPTDIKYIRSDLHIPCLHPYSEPSDDSHIYTKSSSNHPSIPPKPVSKGTSKGLPTKSKSSNPILPSQDHISSYGSTEQSHSSRASRRYTDQLELLSDSQIEVYSSKYPHYYLTDESSPSFKYQPNTQIIRERSDSLVQDYIDTKRLNLIYQTKIKAADSISLVIYKKQILFLKDFFNSIHLIKIKLLLKQLEASHRYQRSKKVLTKCFTEWHRQISERKIYTYLILLKLEKYCSRRYSQEINTAEIFSKKAGAFLLWKIASKLRARRTPLKLSKQLDSSTSTIPFGSEYQSPYQSRYSPRSTNQQFKNTAISSFENPIQDKLSMPSINFNYSFRPAQTIEKLLLRPPNTIHQYIDDMYEVSKEKLEAFYLCADYNTKRYHSSPINPGNLSSNSTPQRLRYCLNTVGKPGAIHRNIL